MPHSHTGRRSRRSKTEKPKPVSTASNASNSASTLTGNPETASAGKSTTQGRLSNHVRSDASPNGAMGKSISLNKSTTGVSHKDSPSRQPNVFEFLDDDEQSDSDSSQSSSSSDSYNRRLHLSARTAESVGAARDRHSYLPSNVNIGPGSSFGTSSPHQTFSVTSKDSTSTDFEPATPPDISPAAANFRLAHNHIAHTKLHMAGAYETTAGSLMESPLPTADHHFDYSAPETYYIPSRENQLLRDQPPSEDPTENSESLIPSGRHMTKNVAKSGSPSFGYAYLASKLDSSIKNDHPKVPPLYRRFQTLNHRILLYLQDEIAQMEEELQSMDEYEEKHRFAVAQRDRTRPVPASRRMDAEAQAFSSFHSRRMELLDRLAHKITQYSTCCRLPNLYAYVRNTILTEDASMAIWNR
jgi:hypothetical protein